MEAMRRVLPSQGQMCVRNKPGSTGVAEQTAALKLPKRMVNISTAVQNRHEIVRQNTVLQQGCKTRVRHTMLTEIITDRKNQLEN